VVDSSYRERVRWYDGAGVVPGVERGGVPELVSAEERHTLRRYARCTEK